MARKVIIDTDPGIDDAIALTMALFDPRLEVVAITAVAGNVSADQATLNVQAIIEQLDPPRLPRIGAATEPENGREADARHINGNDGLGNAGFQIVALHHTHPAEKVLCDEVRAAPGEITIICLGPLTNIARAIQRDREFASLVGQFIIMGGAIAVPGNVTAAAEFNIYCDPPAARAVFRSRSTKTLVPLDVAAPVVLAYDVLNLLPPDDTRSGRFLRQILPFAYRTHHELLGLEGIHAHDAVAIVAATNPELFTVQQWPGDVELEGELTKGMTVFDRRPSANLRSNMDIAMEADPTAVEQMILRSLTESGKQSG